METLDLLKGDDDNVPERYYFDFIIIEKSDVF